MYGNESLQVTLYRVKSVASSSADSSNKEEGRKELLYDAFLLFIMRWFLPKEGGSNGKEKIG